MNRADRRKLHAKNDDKVLVLKSKDAERILQSKYESEIESVSSDILATSIKLSLSSLLKLGLSDDDLNSYLAQLQIEMTSLSNNHNYITEIDSQLKDHSIEL